MPDPTSMMGSIGGMASAYGQGVKAGAQQQQQQPTQNQLVFRPNQIGPQQAPMTQPAQMPITPAQPQQWSINIGTAEPQGPMGHDTAAAGAAAGAASRQVSLQAAINNFRQSQNLGMGTPESAQSTQAKDTDAQRGPNLAELMRQTQADTTQESAAQQYRNNPSAQWAAQQPVAPGQIGTMDQTENYVNQNAYVPPNLLSAVRGTYG